MIDYPAARAVAMVARTGSFEGAARALGVTPSAISQRVRQLEERLGAVLIERGAPCVPTETGALLCRHMEQVGMLEQDLFTRLPGLGDAEPARVTLSIATNADSLGTWFLGAVATFARDARFLLDIVIDDEEHTADWLRRGRVIAGVTALGKPVQGCHLSALGSLRYIATASPDYVARHFPEGVNPAALAEAPALTFNQKDQLQRDWCLRAFGEQVAFPTHWLPSTDGFVEGALSGMGWGLNPEQLVSDHLASGRLVELVPGAHFDRPLFWQVNRFAADRLAALTRAVVTTAKRDLRPPD